MEIVVKKVTSRKEINQFIKFPHKLYADDPNYAPELNISIRERLNRKKNPFFEHSEVDYFLALKGNEIVGRIAAVKNNRYNEYHQSNIGFFGFFDIIEDYAVAKALLTKAYEWNKLHGFEQLIGPANFSTNETIGMLIEGYDSPPQISMTYNKPYYNDFLVQYGFKKELDLYAYNFTRANVPQKTIRISDTIKKRLETQNIIFRNLRLADYDNELNAVKKIYISAWEKNWGFVPPTTKEFEHLAKEMKLVLDPQYCYLAEFNGELIGFALTLPNVNEIFVNIKNGKLLPTGLFKLLRGKNKLKSGRILLLGVKKEYRKKGIEAVLISSLIKDGLKNNLNSIEASWILENNEMMMRAVESLNGDRYKTYRMYGKNID